MKICICDDEKDFIHNFQLLLEQYFKKRKTIHHFNFFENEEDLLSYLDSQMILISYFRYQISNI